MAFCYPAPHLTGVTYGLPLTCPAADLCTVHGLPLTCPAADLCLCYLAYCWPALHLTGVTWLTDDFPSSWPVLHGLLLTCPTILTCITWLAASLLNSWTVLHGGQQACPAADQCYMAHCYTCPAADQCYMAHCYTCPASDLFDRTVLGSHSWKLICKQCVICVLQFVVAKPFCRKTHRKPHKMPTYRNNNFSFFRKATD